MFETLTDTALSTEASAICALAAVAIFGVGWFIKSLGAKRREEEHKRALLEAKRSIPQLESLVRKRETDVTRLEVEVKELSERCTQLTAATEQGELELRSSVRAAKNLRSELDAVKGTNSESNNVIVDGFEDERVEDAEDSRLQQQLQTTQALYENLRTSLIVRDAQIEKLEAQLRHDEQTPVELVEADTAPIHQAQPEGVATLTEAVAKLQAQLQESQQERDMLADMAKSRSDNNHALMEANAEVPKLEQDIEQRDQTIAHREASIKRLINDLEDTKRAQERSEAETVDLTSNLTQRDVEVVELESKFTTLQFTIAQRDERITLLNQDVDNLRKELSELQETVSAQSAVSERETELAGQLAEFEAQYRKLRREAEDLQASVDQKEKWINKLKTSLSEREAQGKLLESRVFEAERATEEALTEEAATEAPESLPNAALLDRDRRVAAAEAQAARASAQLKELEQSLAIYKRAVTDNEIALTDVPASDKATGTGESTVVSLRRTARRPRAARNQTPRRSTRSTATTLTFRPRRQFKKRR